MLPQPIYASIFVVITLVGPTKVSIMKLKCTVLNRMWQHDFMMKQIFFSSILLSENKGRLSAWITILDTHGILILSSIPLQMFSGEDLIHNQLHIKSLFADEGPSITASTSHLYLPNCKMRGWKWPISNMLTDNAKSRLCWSKTFIIYLFRIFTVVKPLL
jgi:hypothetical protein